MSRILDVEIAIKEHGWYWITVHSRTILVPPKEDKRRNWTAIWDDNGIPHYLPKYSNKMEDYK